MNLLREPAPVGTGAFSPSVHAVEAIRTLNSAGKPEAGTALAALLAEGCQVSFVCNPLLFPACFARVPTSYWGAVASWLAVYNWTIALPRWVPEWTGCTTSTAGSVRPHLGSGRTWAAVRCSTSPRAEVRDLTTTELWECMLRISRRRRYLDSSEVMSGGSCCPSEFPLSERWVLPVVNGKLCGAPRLLCAQLCGSPTGTHI